MEQDIRFCTTPDGVRIAYATSGKGDPPLVRVLGWFTHLEYEWENPLWRVNVDIWSERHLYVRYDGRCMGLSDRGVRNLGLEASVIDLETVIDAAGLEKVALFALSAGGPTGITYAIRHPERVSHLILYGSFARLPGTTEERLTMLQMIRHGWDSDVPAYRQFFTGLFMPDSPDADAIRAFNEIQRVSATADDVVAWMSSFPNDFDLRGSLSQVHVPTLVMHRRGDAVVPFELGRELAMGIRGARFLPLDGRNHWPLPGEPVLEQIGRAIGEFLGTGDQPQSTPASSSGLVTILFTDMVGSTDLTQRVGDDKAQEAVRRHNVVVRQALKEHGGTEIKHTGDGIMASFASGRRALDCAVAIQRALDTDEGLLQVRIGLNAGEPVAEEEDLYGTSVQLAARVCARAEPGQILVSNVVRELTMGKGFLFADVGDVALKGFEDPVRLYEVPWQAA